MKIGISQPAGSMAIPVYHGIPISEHVWEIKNCSLKYRVQKQHTLHWQFFDAAQQLASQQGKQLEVFWLSGVAVLDMTFRLGNLAF